MDKQIEEMAKDIACLISWDEDEILTVNCLETAKRLYLKDYRKASDVAREIFEEIEKNLATIDNFGINQFRCIDARIFAELKKKYESEENKE